MCIFLFITSVTIIYIYKSALHLFYIKVEQLYSFIGIKYFLNGI